MNIYLPEDEKVRTSWTDKHQINLFVRRFDMLHPLAGGNKLFKLKYWLKDLNKSHTIISFGGAWSNHLLALAAYCHSKGIRPIGIIRGEKPKTMNPRLEIMEELGMILTFISREQYRRKNETDFIEKLRHNYGDCLIIPEGGGGLLGIRGASEMVSDVENYDYIILPAGTGTTAAGITMRLEASKTKVQAFQVLKGNGIIKQEIIKSCGFNSIIPENLEIFEEYHFGGYAKINQELELFRNTWYMETNIPVDLVYGAKALYGFAQLSAQNYYPKGSRILYVHTGGLDPI